MNQNQGNLFPIDAGPPATGFKYPQPDTVTGRVLALLLRGRVLTHGDCLRGLRTMRLAHYIYSLGVDSNWPIERHRIVVVTGDHGRTARISEYWLSPEIIALAGERGRRYARAALGHGS